MTRVRRGFRLADDPGSMIRLTPEEEADLVEVQTEKLRGEFATEAEVEAVLSK